MVLLTFVRQSVFIFSITLLSFSTSNYKTIVLSNSEWDYEKKKYIDNLNNKYVYEMKVEKTKEQNDIKYENSSNLGANDLVDILGAEVIEYK